MTRWGWFGVALVVMLGLLAPDGWAQDNRAATEDVIFQQAATQDGAGTTFKSAKYYSSASIQVTIAGTATVTFNAAQDETNFIALKCMNVNSGAASTTATSSGLYQCNTFGHHWIKAPITDCAGCTVTVSGTFSTASPDNFNVSATSVVPGTSATNLGKAEDAAAASGDTGVAVLGVRKDTATQVTNTDGDYTAPSYDAYGVPFARQDHPNRILCTVTVSTATTIQAVGGSCAAPGASLSLYITDVLFSASAAGIVADAFPTLKYGTGGTCGTGTTVFWGALTAAAIVIHDNRTVPIKIPANNEVCWISSTAGSKFLVLGGFIAP